MSYEVAGDGDLVVMVMGTGSPGRVWQVHQVPALVAAGLRVATFDSRGVGASPLGEQAVTIDDLVGDVASLIEHLGGRAHVVGTSLGARVVQELALTRPELVDKVVAMAAHARLDPVQSMFTAGQQALFDEGVTLPAAYHSAVTAVLNLSPATLRDEGAARDWLDVLEFSSGPMSEGERAQLAVSTQLCDRRDAYRDIRAPLLVVGFADDVMIPCALSREVAEVVPGARYVEIADTGHFGYLERPSEVNRLLVEFLGS